MAIVELDWPPSWSLDASGTGESTKFLWVRAVGLFFRPPCPPPTVSTCILYSPLFRSHQETKVVASWTQRSASTISRKKGDCEQFISPCLFFILQPSCTRCNLHKNGYFHTTSSMLVTGLVKLLQNCNRDVNANSKTSHFSFVCLFVVISFNKEQMDFCLFSFCLSQDKGVVRNNEGTVLSESIRK